MTAGRSHDVMLKVQKKGPQPLRSAALRSKVAKRAKYRSQCFERNLPTPPLGPPLPPTLFHELTLTAPSRHFWIQAHVQCDNTLPTATPQSPSWQHTVLPGSFWTAGGRPKAPKTMLKLNRIFVFSMRTKSPSEGSGTVLLLPRGST